MTSNGLFKNVKTVVAYTYATSVIDHEKVSATQLGQSIFEFLGGSATPEAVADYSQRMEKAYESLKKIAGEHAAQSFAVHIDSSAALRALEAAEALPEHLK